MWGKHVPRPRTHIYVCPNAGVPGYASEEWSGPASKGWIKEPIPVEDSDDEEDEWAVRMREFHRSSLPHEM